MRVRVFRNLTRRCLSIQARTTTGWRTVAHATDVSLSGVTFTVSEAGRQRVLATGKKTVHAWAEGEMLAWNGRMRDAFLHTEMGALVDLPIMRPILSLPTPITYDPRRFKTFVVRHSDAPVIQARRAVLSTTCGVTIAA